MNSIAQRYRRWGFWELDRFKGSPIRFHYENVSFIMENYGLAEAESSRNVHIRNLLDYAQSSVPYYSDKKRKALIDFPVVNKNDFRRNYDLFKSDHPYFKESREVVTSGSTGTPFIIKQDHRKHLRNTADTIFFGELAGFKIGQKLYYLKIWNQINRKNILSKYLQNIVPVNVSNLNKERLDELVSRLKSDNSDKGLLGYSSAFETISKFLAEKNFEPIKNNTRAIIAMSEGFDPSVKHTMSNFFNAIAVSRYSNMENGIIAQQLRDGSEDFIINHASYVVEVLDLQSDSPVPQNTPGRIVVSDLFNYCMPMIRYDTGDIGVLGEKEVMGFLRPVLTKVEGRRMDQIYNTSGDLVSSFIITNNMWKYNEIDQYQFVQNAAKEYVFILNTGKSFSRERELISEFREYLGKDADIKIEYVQEIPVLDSGKRKKVVNNFLKK